jgi:hypothetical protein
LKKAALYQLFDIASIFRWGYNKTTVTPICIRGKNRKNHTSNKRPNFYLSQHPTPLQKDSG